MRDGEPIKTDAFVCVRKRREYKQDKSFPKISIDRNTYQQLQTVALETGESISSVAKQAISFALDRIEWVDE